MIITHSPLRRAYNCIVAAFKLYRHLKLIRPKCHSDIPDITVSLTNSILCEAFKLSEDMTSSCNNSWCGCIKDIFKYLKLEYLYERQESFKTNFIINRVKSNLISEFADLWKTNIFNDNKKRSNCSNKLRTYRTFKHNFSFETYLDFGNREQRQLLSKFRISDHPLRIETGRYFGLEVKDRLCSACQEQVEDEIHCLI